MDLNMRGKAVVITGGSSGIGLAAAHQFLKEGCQVAICSRSRDKLAAVVEQFAQQGFSVYSEAVDVSDPDQISRFGDHVFQKFGRVDVWVNNAGGNIVKPLMEMSADEFNFVLHTNLTSVFWGIRTAAQYMIPNGGGSIINTSSFTAKIPVSKRVAYAASKAGVISVTQTSAGELAPYGIRVNAIIPGLIETPIAAARIGADREGLRDQIALQRFGAPEDLAALYVFLASEAAGYITGAAYDISGGKFCIQDIVVPWGKKL